MKNSVNNNFVPEDFEIDGTVLEKYNGKSADVVIPDFITGVVAELDRYGQCYSAFADRGGYVRSITVPKSLTHIDGLTFYMCYNLERITVDGQNEAYYSEGNCIIERGSKTLIAACKNSVIPQDIKYIADHALVNCHGEANLTYNGTKRQWGAIDKHTDWDVGNSDCTVRCADGDFTVDDAPFRVRGTCLWSYRGRSAKVVIPDGIKRILGDAWEGMYCFEYCDFVKSITVPKSVEYIDGNTFYGCFDLEEITVDSQNPKYYSQGNCIIEKTDKKLVVGCKTSVIPNDVKIIGGNAFYACNGLTGVYYEGTEADWNNVFVDGNAGLDSATLYYYSASQPTKSGNYWHYGTDGVTPVKW